MSTPVAYKKSACSRGDGNCCNPSGTAVTGGNSHHRNRLRLRQKKGAVEIKRNGMGKERSAHSVIEGTTRVDQQTAKVSRL